MPYLVCLLFVFLIFGCGLPREYHDALQAVPAKLGEVDSFIKKYPDGTKSIAYFQQNGKSVYTCKNIIHGRYVIRIDVKDVKFDKRHAAVDSYGAIIVSLEEVVRVDSEDGRLSVRYGESKVLDRKELDLLVLHNWEFDKAGVILTKDKPVDGIEIYWKTLVSRNKG